MHLSIAARQDAAHRKHSSIEHVKTLRLHSGKGPREARHGCMKLAAGCCSSALHMAGSHGWMCSAKITLSRQVTDSHVVARNQVAHDFAQIRDDPRSRAWCRPAQSPRLSRLVRKRARGFSFKKPAR